MISILVVDDDTRILRMVSAFLRTDGFDVATAADGQSALDALASAPPALVLLDLNLPDIQGDEVFRKARATGYHGPIVLISADIRAEQIADSLGAAFLAKPFDPSELFSLAESLTSTVHAKAS